MRRRGGDGGAVRVWGLCRVSSQRQDREGTSLDGQEQSITRWAATEKLPAPTFIVEVESGAAERVEQREGLQRLLREARRGDVVVVYAVDRWSRDLVYTVQSVRALVARGLRWFSIRESLDATTREGDERLGLMAWVADSERKRIKERTLGRKADLADDGYYVRGSPPIGYVTRARKLVPGPEQHIPREAFERCARGEGLQAISNVLPRTKGRGPWDKGAVHKILRNRHYLGEMKRSDGTWHPTHEPLVDRDLWERAHAAMAARKQIGRLPGDGWSAARLLRGLARCALCGRKVSVTLQRERLMGGRSMGYACAGYLTGVCKARQVHAERLDAFVDEAALGRLKELRHELAKQKAPPRAPETETDYGAKVAKAKRKRERLISAYADDTITKDDLKNRLAKLDVEIGKLTTSAAKVRRRKAAAERAAKPEVRVELLAEMTALTRAWQRAPVDVRRGVLARIVERIEVRPGRPRLHEVLAPKIRWKSVEDLAVER